jgi:hypothetical protein
MILTGKHKEEVMPKEPWEEEIYDDGEETLKRTNKLNGIKADRLLTILAIIFFIIIVAMVCFLVYLSTGGSDKKKQMSGFYNGETTVVAASSAPAAEQTEEASAEESEESTITVLAGEGEAAIAARAGISIAELEQLNPSHMSTGSWYANPGDVVKIK